MKKLTRKKLVLYIFIFFVLVGVSLGLITYRMQPQQQALQPTAMPTQPQDIERYEATFDGDVVCLPHKNANGPQTLECALGLKIDTDLYYALDAGGVNPPPYQTGERIRVRGTVTPIEMLSTDMWQKYNVKGIFSVKGNVEKLEN
jgi:hypothetical protein